jgi:hypothetical protein
MESGFLTSMIFGYLRDVASHRDISSLITASP